jgi:outer membrane protein assembly factor BamB
MSTTAEAPAARGPVRVWFAVLVLASVAAAWTVPSLLAPRSLAAMVAFALAPVIGAAAALVWWAFFADVRGPFRWAVPALVVVPLVGLAVTLHRGNELVVVIYGLAAALVVWLGWLGVSAPLPGAARRAGLLALLTGLWVVVGMLRVHGTDADVVPDLRWRWQLSDEERFLAEKATAARARVADATPVEAGPGDWPGFRGPNRDGVTSGARLDPDWAARPPEVVWRKRVGPGWGSFAVAGGKLFTQEQRGPDEVVACYDAGTGAEVWEFKAPGRFEETISGAGPRATPTVHGSKVYAQGANGHLHRLDAATGQREWTADVVAAGGTLPQWGFAASPLVTDGLVVVYAGGGTDKGTAAFKIDTGEPAWVAGRARHGYASAHPAVLGGVRQVLVVSDYGIESFRPADGAVLWEHAWPVGGGNRATQPLVLSDTDVMIGTGVGGDQGVRRLRVTRAGDAWDVKTVWSTRGARPYFNDGVLVGGHFYGFDDGRFCCVDPADGRQLWKDTGYGHGQVLGVADQGLLLVQAERGAVALVEANPTDFSELAKVPALTGKTWNHPVVAHGFLYVRNGQEAACFRLPLK